MHLSEFSFELKPSPFGGIGVFATHDIPCGTEVFTGKFEARILKIEQIPPPLRKFCIYVNKQEAICPARFDRLELGWFVNHSFDPNVKADIIPSMLECADAHQILHSLQIRKNYTIKDIKTGDEIVIDYNTLGEPEHLKEDYFRLKQVSDSSN